MNFELILKNISRHIRLDEKEVDYFTSLLSSKKIRRKEFLLREGEVNTHETFINKGCLRNYTIDDKGTEHIIVFAIEDWWTSDLYSFLTQTPATFNIDALEDTEVLQISKDNLEKLFENIPKFERFFRIMFQNAFIAQQQRISSNLSLTAEERYNRFIAKYPQMEQRISQKQMAAYLGITPEFLSMLRKKKAGK
jgi:CRP-like cAMP-binding protein